MWWRALVCWLCLAGAVAPGQAQDASRPYSIEKVLGNLSYASGIAWMKDHLLVADLPGGKITKIDSEGPSVFRDDIHASAIASDSENRVYICDVRQHRILRIDRKGKLDVLASEYEGKPFLGPAGVVVGHNNSVWFTDSAWASEDQNKPRPYYAVFHISNKGELSLVARMTGRPNGIALSPDNKTLYVVDSDSRTVMSWDVDKSGTASNQKVLSTQRKACQTASSPDRTGRFTLPHGRLRCSLRQESCCPISS